MKDNLDELTIPELEIFAKELKPYIKNRMDEHKEAITKAFKDNVEVGDEVSFLFKDGEETGRVVKINEKSFTAEFSYDDDTVKKAIQFHRFINKISAEEKVA